MPKLRVLAGPSYDEMEPITANSDMVHDIKSDIFEGKVIAYIKGFPDEEGNVLDSDYFSRADRKGVTWSIQVQGRFLKPVSADEVLFGNTFDRALKLPWGAGAALKFMNFIDPTLEHDLMSKEHPWALSPLISTMPHFVHTPLSQAKADSDSGYESDSEKTSPPAFPSARSIGDDVSHLSAAVKKGTKLPTLATSKQRRSHFRDAKARKTVVFGPNDIITTDFCYGFITFPELSLNIPGGISFDLTKYWDGQPVRFVCCQRAQPGDAHERVFWCVAIERVD